LDLEVLLAEALGKDRTYLYTWPDRSVSMEQLQTFNEMVARRFRGEPVAHIIGLREFWSLPLQVNASTLIPRPDTELLVETVLNKFSSHPSLTLIDLGTGTGAIALALAKEHPCWDVYASDVSAEACLLAARNQKKCAIGNVNIFCGQWLTAVSQSTKFDVIVSNPPYICAKDKHLNEGDVRFEPLSALVSGRDGLADIEEILLKSIEHLKPGGWLLLEHGYDQKMAVQRLFAASGYESIETVNDYGGNPRVTLGCRP
jgi:release factor glutamine methyltransferase